MKSYSVTIQMKATEQYFPVVLFIMLYKLALTFESVDERQISPEAELKEKPNSFFLLFDKTSLVTNE